MSVLRRYPLISFVVLTYLITWTAQITAIVLASHTDFTLSNEANFGHFLSLFTGELRIDAALPYIVFSLGAGPLIASIVLTWACDGRDGLKTLWQRCTRWNVGPKWYLIVLTVPLGLSVAAYAIGSLASGGPLELDPAVPVALFVPFFLFMAVFTGIAEEPGWRGFALPRLQQRYTAEKSSWILGPIWGLWHLPFIAYYNRGQGLPPLVGALVGLTIGIVGWTIVNTWVFNSTNSVFMVILLHGWGNALQSYLVLSTGDPVAQSAYTILPWALALVLLKVYGSENLARTPRPTSTRSLT